MGCSGSPIIVKNITWLQTTMCHNKGISKKKHGSCIPQLHEKHYVLNFQFYDFQGLMENLNHACVYYTLRVISITFDIYAYFKGRNHQLSGAHASSYLTFPLTL